MSFDIFLQRFDGGEPSSGDASAVRRVLDLLIEDSDTRWARIRTQDGEADVYGVDDCGSGLMINHTSGRAIWDVIFDLARAGGFAVMPVGCGTCVTNLTMAAELPRDTPRPIVLVRCGADILLVVESN